MVDPKNVSNKSCGVTISWFDGWATAYNPLLHNLSPYIHALTPTK